MSEFLTNLLYFIVAISVLVAIHEYGHYIVGRWCGMKVLRYSIGFGKPLITWVGKDPDRTEYCVAAVPLGGYVRFLDSREADIAPADDGRAFDQRPVPARIAVLFAGPLFNFLFAIAAYWVIFVSGVPAMIPTVGEVTPDSYAASAGLRHGDRIVAVGDKKTPEWEAALQAMFDEMAADGRIALQLQAADGAQRTGILDVGDDAARLTEPGMIFDGLGFQPWRPPAVVGAIEPDGAASGVDLRAGDRIVAVNDTPVASASDLIAAVSPRADETVRLEFYRGEQLREASLTVAAVEQDGRTIGRIGVRLKNDFAGVWYNRQYEPLAAIGAATAKTWDTMGFTLRMLGRMVTGDVSLKNISGPINIAQFAGDSAERGLNQFLTFLALVSISLGVLNLLPVPILDGGQILYQTVEWVKGSPLSERAQIFGQQLGIAALIMLMSLAFYNDFARIFG